MSGHTPAPWVVGGNTGFRNQIAIDPSIGCVYGAGAEIAANAKLVAAAPDLLEACQQAEHWLTAYGRFPDDYVSPVEMLRVLRAAIEKAERP